MCITIPACRAEEPKVNDFGELAVIGNESRYVRLLHRGRSFRSCQPIREAILNAVSHRNYQLGGSIFVRREDRIHFRGEKRWTRWYPGPLPEEDSEAGT